MSDTRSWVALLRGINVGTAKRVPMAELRAAVESLGGTDVKTLLNSGNVVYDTCAEAGPSADAIRGAVRERTGVDSEVIVVSGDAFRAVAEACPLRAAGRPGNRVSIAFPAAPLDPTSQVPDPAALAPEELALTATAVYQWLPDGQLATKVPAAWWRGLGVTVTARNDATVQKLVALLDARA
ncbi:uncharacterized protein (DUF1697 family) [Frondihabitans sp. PhB188]|uniref:DUF1697 domain-containing protein n=1 Tax=Frondihabitans sp. PhB188 TaxID=2485200 RepID=UPI000F47CEE6|nr:DUF1697 domain-containing protein [Frondihabitans sp. PhB188]ROQ38231.1 uncharacterized protein (DUF1697 family) [Frondihabitans sp. PhB188]